MTVGVVGDDRARVETAVESVESTGRTAVTGTANEVVDAAPSLVVAVGEPAMLALVRAGVAAPILPVETGRAVASVRLGALESALTRVFDGEWTATDRLTLSVTAADEPPAPALMDVMLVTTDPARISEYRVTADGRTVSQFRADGVVVATPTGSRGYARRLDGPILAPGTETVAVVPIAPFAIDHDRWVLDARSDVRLRVARDEGRVSLFTDDAERGQVPVNRDVSIGVGDAVSIVAVEPDGSGSTGTPE